MSNGTDLEPGTLKNQEDDDEYPVTVRISDSAVLVKVRSTGGGTPGEMVTARKRLMPQLAKCVRGLGDTRLVLHHQAATRTTPKLPNIPAREFIEGLKPAGHAVWLGFKVDGEAHARGVLSSLHIHLGSGDADATGFETMWARLLRAVRGEIADDAYLGLVRLIRGVHNVIAVGVPGTGKSHSIARIESLWKTEFSRELDVEILVLHPSTAYEDVIEGLRPTGAAVKARTFREQVDEAGAYSEPTLRLTDGMVLELCRRADAEPDRDFLLVLDEINRANVPRVLGDLMLVLESTKRQVAGGEPPDHAVRLAYSRRLFWVPENLYVLGTMNSTDRSAAPLDAALRRRFAFRRLEPLDDEELLSVLRDTDPDAHVEFMARDIHVWGQLNHALRGILGPDFVLGHSYWMALAKRLQGSTQAHDQQEHLANLWRYEILPQLIDVVTMAGAEELLDSRTRDSWLVQRRGELTSDEVSPNRMGQAFQQLEEHLATLGIPSAHLAGTGLSRGLVVASETTISDGEPDEDSEIAAGGAGSDG